MIFSRRYFLKVATVGIAASPLACTRLHTSLSVNLDRVLPAYVDTLLPTDQAPGAVELGVPAQIVSLLHRKRALLPLYQVGTAWLDTQAMARHGSGFEALSLVERDALVMQLSEQSEDILARFFHKSLRHTMMFYYSNPRVWASLGLSGAPQPHGFLDFAQAPARRG